MSEQFMAAGPGLFPPKFDNPYCFFTHLHLVPRRKKSVLSFT